MLQLSSLELWQWSSQMHWRLWFFYGRLPDEMELGSGGLIHILHNCSTLLETCYHAHFTAVMPTDISAGDYSKLSFVSHCWWQYIDSAVLLAGTAMLLHPMALLACG